VASTEGPLQFGVREPGKAYAERPCAYGVLVRADGLIAVARITRPETSYYDRPGGALDPGEDEAAALVREYGEETGLRVKVDRPIARARQYMLMADGKPVNNLSGLYLATLEGEDPALKIEHDHTLAWLTLIDALRLLRHDSHAWAVAAWLRRQP
jgi:8-oxo-dGTP diphosphatase